MQQAVITPEYMERLEGRLDRIERVLIAELTDKRDRLSSELTSPKAEQLAKINERLAELTG